jgi:antitoxin PrlF
MSYTGKISTIGNSDAIRLDKSLFKQHPEFKQKASVRADVIGPGTMLLQVVDDAMENEGEDENDPIVRAFLSFIEKDMLAYPANITSVSANQMAEVAELTSGIVVTEDDDLG